MPQFGAGIKTNVPPQTPINIDRIAADGKGSHDTIGIEVRVVDASSGLVLDSISAQEHDSAPHRPCAVYLRRLGRVRVDQALCRQ
jgi:hypothetical protein